MTWDEVPGVAARSAPGQALAGVDLGEEGLRFGSAAIFQLFESIPVAISVTAGSRHRFVYANARYRDALIPGRTDPTGRELREVLGAKLPERTYELRDRVIVEGRSQSFPEEPIPPLSGAPSMYWDVTFFPLLNARGSATGILTFAVDVTHRVKARMEAEERAEAERRRAEEVSLDRTRLELALEATEMGIWEWNAQTGETIWSDTQKAIWGLEPEREVTFESWRDSIHPDDRERVIGRLEHTLDPHSGGAQLLEHRIVRPSGAVRWIASYGRMIYDDAGRPLRLIGTAQDITHKRERDEDLQRALEGREILLREVNHRVKNSLQIVSAMLSLQSARLDDPAPRSAILEAQSRVQAVAAVHDRLYRSEDLKSVDLDIFLETLCRDLERTVAADGGVRVEVTTAPVKIGNDRAVPVALILNELLTNAIKYAYPETGGTIRISLRRAEGAQRATLRVADDGVGLPDGFDERRARSLGYRIIEGLARQMQADLAIERRRPGTAVSISFDLEAT